MKKNQDSPVVPFGYHNASANNASSWGSPTENSLLYLMAGQERANGYRISLPPSSRGQLTQVIAQIATCGVTEDFSNMDLEAAIPSYEVADLVEKVKDFETVLAK
jgi:hypothetical protein